MYTIYKYSILVYKFKFEISNIILIIKYIILDLFKKKFFFSRNMHPSTFNDFCNFIIILVSAYTGNYNVNVLYFHKRLINSS